MKTIYLFANWKMYLDYDESNILAKAIAGQANKLSDNIKMVIFPSALALYPVGQVLADVKIDIGAQNTYWVDKGGYTGEISAKMFKQAGCKYALVGHSERRHQFGESGVEVRKKIEAALAVGLTPVLCVGETQTERESSLTQEVVGQQLQEAYAGLSWPAEHELIVAYEPVWAIGSGVACNLYDIEQVHSKIREFISKLNSQPIILYGGSVRETNIAQYLNSPQVDGVLVGSSSTKLASWMSMVNQAVK